MRYARPLAIVSLAAAFFSLPLFIFGFPLLGHDGPVHLLYCRQFASQFWSGEWYPRWLMGTHKGFGSPAFFVYGPVPFYITSLIAPLGRWVASKPPGYVELTASAALALWCSGIAAYFWLRRNCAETAAVAGAVVYMASPYHLTVDLYMRAAFAEFWAFVWMPLILYFTDGLLRKKRYAVIGVAVSYALLAMTHPLTTLMFSPVPVAFALFMSKPGDRLSNLTRLCTGLLLGAGLAAIYILPALDHRPNVASAKYLMAPVFQWYANFPPLDRRLFVVGGSWPSYVQFIAILMILFAAAAICFSMIVRTPAAKFWLAIAGLSLFMMHPASSPIWRLLPVLGQLQHTWRFQTVVTVAIAALTAMAWPLPRKIAAGGLCGIALLWLGFFGYMWHVLARQDLRSAWAADFSNDPFLSDWTATGVTDAPMEQVHFESGAGSASVEKWAPRDIRIQLRCDRESSLLLHQFYYPGWTASVASPLESSPQGLIRVKAPPGEYELRLWLDGGRMENVGRWVSAASVAVLLLTITLPTRNRKKL